MYKYNFKKIEKKWQKKWNDPIFISIGSSDSREKFYSLTMIFSFAYFDKIGLSRFL